MNTSLFSALIYLLGFIGLASVGLLPLRAWQVFRDAFRNGESYGSKKALAAVAVLVAVAALWCDVQITARIFKCLTQTYCGPGVASGWTYLAMLGVVYLAFEVVLFALRRLGSLKTIKPTM